MRPERSEQQENIRMSGRQYSFAKILHRNQIITFEYARTVNQNTLASFYKRGYLHIDLITRNFHATEFFNEEISNFSGMEFHRKNKNGKWARNLKIRSREK